MHFGGKPFDPSAVNGEASPLASDTATPAQPWHGAFVAAPTPKWSNRIVDSICRNERRESGIYLKYTGNLSLRLVAFFFFFSFFFPPPPYAKRRQKAGFANCGSTAFYDGKVNSLLDDIPFVLLARRRFVAACVRLHQRFPSAIREFLTDKFV